ncbi:Asp23/Gls24 family envelope stress response protein [Arthrobacter sp. Soc17.1.1.1]|uniref:Asp23/Gls24 family envelope stress response protein n=1 Tax=Arthrobacter sp. Soc17.1.1.1 TaxID=3121277 RepID=UPI002FE4CA04
MAIITPTSGVRHEASSRPDHAAAAGTGPAARQEPPAVRGRGTLTMSEKVVEKVAAQGASELPFVGGFGGGVLGVGRHAGTGQRPRASVNLSGTGVTVFLDIALDFPADVAARSADIRRHVTSTLERVTGLRVRRIDITIKALTTGSHRTARSLQ